MAPVVRLNEARTVCRSLTLALPAARRCAATALLCALCAAAFVPASSLAAASGNELPGSARRTATPPRSTRRPTSALAFGRAVPPLVCRALGAEGLKAAPSLCQGPGIAPPHPSLSAPRPCPRRRPPAPRGYSLTVLAAQRGAGERRGGRTTSQKPHGGSGNQYRAAAEHGVKRGDTLTVDIDALAGGTGKGAGAGVAKVDGLVFFVEGALPGSRVQAKVTGVKPDYVEACIERVVTPSPDAVAAPCGVFRANGGGKNSQKAMS